MTRNWFRPILSVFIVFHLFAVMILPGPQSMLVRNLAWLVLPYANMLSFNTTWQFFSPGPSPTFYLEYEIETNNGDSLPSVDTDGKDVEVGSFSDVQYWPPRKGKHTYSDGYNRVFYSMRFFALFPDRMANFFVPWMCERHPEATAFTFQSVFETIPNIERAKGLLSFQDVAEKQPLPRQRFRCPRPSSQNLIRSDVDFEVAKGPDWDSQPASVK